MPESYLLDSSAFIAYLQAEGGGPRVLELLEKAAKGELLLFASFVSLAEIQYITEADFDASAAKQTIADLKKLAVTWIHSDDALCASAADIKAGHKLSFADAFVVAAALRLDSVLIHKDPEIEKIPAPLKQEMLPLKNAAAKSG